MVEHGDADLTWNCIVQSHAQISVNLATAHLHLTGSVFEDAFALFAKILNDLVDHLSLLVTQLAVVDMKAYSHLLAVDHLIGNAGVTRVELETNIGQALDKLLVVQ